MTALFTYGRTRLRSDRAPTPSVSDAKPSKPISGRSLAVFGNCLDDRLLCVLFDALVVACCAVGAVGVFAACNDFIVAARADVSLCIGAVAPFPLIRLTEAFLTDSAGFILVDALGR